MTVAAFITALCRDPVCVCVCLCEVHLEGLSVLGCDVLRFCLFFT